MSSSGHQVTIVFDTNVFAVETIKKAAYKYLDRLTVDFHLDGYLLTCLLSFSQETSESDTSTLVADFKKEVLDQDLRERIKAETAPIRNLILAHAFSKTGLIVDEQVSGN
jgi:His-Xaa-Ser system protein HxsD